MARSHRGSCQESTGPAVFVCFHVWPITPVWARMNGLGHWAEWDEWAGVRQEFCYKFSGHPAHAQVLCKNGLCGSVHNAKVNFVSLTVMCRFVITSARTFTPNFWFLLVEGLPGRVLLSIDSRLFLKQLNLNLISATPIVSSSKTS